MGSHRLPRRPSLESVVHRVDAQRPGEVPNDTVPSGFPSIDRLMGGGLRRRDLVVLGGDVGVGKSSLVLGLALRVARQNLGVALLSGEVDEVRAGALSDQMRAGIGAAAVRLRGLPLSLLPLAAQDLESALARLDDLGPLALIVLDYLQLVPPPAGTSAGAQDE